MVTGSIPAGLAMGVTRLGLVWGRPPEPAGLLVGAVVVVVGAPVVGGVEEDAGALVGDA